MSGVKEAIQNLAKTNKGFDALIELATVVSVNEAAMTCTVKLFDNDMDLEDVKLKPVMAELATDMGPVNFPEENSKVLIAQINNNPGDLFVVSCSKVKKISLDAGSLLKMVMDVQAGGLALDLSQLTFNGGKNKGLPKIQPLIAKLNQLEKKYNDLLADFKAHKHLGVTTGMGVSGIADKQSGSKIELSVIQDLENTKILT